MLVFRYRRLEQPQSARWTHVRKFSVLESLPTFRLKIPQPLDHLGDRTWKRILTVRIQPLQSPDIPLRPTRAQCRGMRTELRNLRSKALRILKNQPNMVTR